MNVSFYRKFEKSLDKLKDEKIRGQVAEAVRLVMTANSIQEITNLKKLKGYKTAYRIKLGEYRIGLIIENREVFFVDFAHRKDIYRRFP